MQNMNGNKISLSQWVRKNAGTKYKKRDSLLKGAMKEFNCTLKQARDRVSDEISNGRIPETFRGRAYVKSKSSGKPGVALSPVKRHKVKASKVPSKFRAGVDVAVVKKEYDDEGKIAQGLENLGTQVIRDADFRSELMIPNDRWKVVTDRKKFDKNKVELKGKQYKGVYWGSVEVLVELRKAVDMV